MSVDIAVNRALLGSNPAGMTEPKGYLFEKPLASPSRRRGFLTFGF